MKLFFKNTILGIFLYLAGNFGVAQEEYKNTIKEYIENGQFEQALQAINEAEDQVGNKNEWLNLHRGFVMVQLKQYDSAIKYYKKLIKRYDSNPEPYNNLGVIYRLQRNFDKAIETFNLGLEKFPNYSRLYENLGDTYMQLAQESYNKGMATESPSTILEIKSDLSNNFHNVVLDNLSIISGQKEALHNSDQSTSTQGPSKAETKDPAKLEILDTIQSWVDAWSQRDPEYYFVHYSKDFVPADGSNVKAWAHNQSISMSNSEYIEISLEKISIELVTPSFAVASFVQNFESNLLNNQSNKQLSFRKYEEGWLITDERVLPQ